MKNKNNAVFLTGDYGLVREWSEMLRAHDFTPFCAVTSQGERGPLPDYCALRDSPPADASMVLELTILNGEQKRKNIQSIHNHLPAGLPILTSSVTVTATEQISWISGGERLLGVCAFPTLTARPLIEIAPSVQTSKACLTAAEDFFFRLQKDVAVVQDRIGMVMPRILCSLINEAFFAVMDGISSPDLIDVAMKLGTNYPSGPVEWANAAGLQNVVAVLDALYRDLGDDRYRIAPLLRQMALGNKWWNG